MWDQTPFGQFARWAFHATGQPIAFCLAVITIVIWALLGPVFPFSIGRRGSGEATARRP